MSMLHLCLVFVNGSVRACFHRHVRCVSCQSTDDPQTEVCGPLAGLQGLSEQSSLPSVDFHNKAVSFIQQVGLAVISSQTSHTHTHSHTLGVKGTFRTEHSSVKLHVILIAVMSAHESTRLTSQHDQFLISSCDSSLLLLYC